MPRWKSLNRPVLSGPGCALSGSMRRRLSTGWRKWRRSILPFVGNDIIDLKDPANVQKSTDLRFLRKILTDAEIEQVRDSSDPDRALWSLWACKEAAFKVMKKRAGDAAFMPRRWFVFLQPDGKNGDGHDCRQNRQFPGVIQIPQVHEIPCLIYSTPAYIHCIAADNPDALAQSSRAVNTLPRRP